MEVHNAEQQNRKETTTWNTIRLPTLAAISLSLASILPATGRAEESIAPPLDTPDPVVQNLSSAELETLRSDLHFEELQFHFEPDPEPGSLTPATAEDALTLPAEQKPSQGITPKPVNEITGSPPQDDAVEPETQQATTSYLDDTTRKVTNFGVALTTVGLGVLSVLAAIRGVVKGSIEVSLWRKSIKRFDRREFTDMVALNAYSLIPEGDRLVLQGDTKDRPQLTEFLGNRGARNFFMKAALRCTYAQPFVCLEFPKDYQEHWLSKKLLAALTTPAYYLSFKKLFKKYHQEHDPNEERFSALNRINKLLREAVSASYNSSSAGLIAKQFQKELPVRYYEKTVYVIPICHVAPPGVKHSRSLTVATLSAEDFARFGNPEEVEKMLPCRELSTASIEAFRKAYQEHLAYKRFTNSRGMAQELFPLVRVLLPYYDNESSDRPGEKSGEESNVVELHEAIRREDSWQQKIKQSAS